MKLLDLLIGKTIQVKTNVGTLADLEIQSIDYRPSFHGQCIGGGLMDSGRLCYEREKIKVNFTNGYSIEYSDLNLIHVS